MTRGISWDQSLVQHKVILGQMADSLDPLEVDRVLDAMRACKGVMFFTGVGQNQLLAAAVASRFRAWSFRAIGMSPIAFLQGNPGVLRTEDLLVFISKSGETSQLLACIQHPDVRSTTTLAVHATRGSTLERYSDLSLHLSIAAEADHMGMAPTASTICFLSVLQSIGAQVWSERYDPRASLTRRSSARKSVQEPQKLIREKR